MQPKSNVLFPAIKHNGFSFMLIVKIALLMGTLAVVKLVTRPNKAKKEEIVIDYERLW